MLYLIGLTLTPFLLFLCILGFIKFKNYDTAHSLIFYAILFGFTSEVLMKLSARYFHNNIIVYNLSSIIEFLLLFSFYYTFIGKGLNKYMYLLFLSVFLVSNLTELYNKGPFTMFTYSFLIKNTILLFLATVAFRKIINSHKTSIISDYSIFWINTSILIYYSCTLFIFGLRKYTLHLPSLALVTVYLHLFFIFVFYGLLSIGLWKTSRN